ncbi:hypothetical protein DQT32_05260 [Salmonella enterica subsp. enterica serovar Braenderup]|nr:hypothetical protein [Salmonella enterica subsp. enterica serovar Braenderup]
MLKQIGNDNNIPNSYVYTSHKGSEYIFLEGIWYNCENMMPVDSSKNFKMNQSALRQISESNTNSTLKIGNKYLINESEYVYVGRGKVTKDGYLLHESINSTIVSLMEADDDSSEDTSTEVPNGYILTSGKGKTYIKRNGTWYSTETKKPVNSGVVAPIERAAKAAIDKHNEKAAVKIGDEWKSKSGVTYKYVGGNRFVGDNGKMLPQDTAKNVLQHLWQKSDEERAQNEEEPEQSQDSGTNDTGSTDTSSQPQGTPPSPKPQEQSTGSGDPLQSLADKIKSHPKGGKIAVLLSRGDPLSLMAADILLNGQQSEAAQILNSLNNED